MSIVLRMNDGHGLKKGCYKREWYKGSRVLKNKKFAVGPL